jgi:pimeloyl-ACP methyl ester carboxylesterase
VSSADLYGRGYSDAPQTTYDTSLYVIQLALLMQHIHWDQARLVGVSMVKVVMCGVLRTLTDGFWVGFRRVEP